jgi:hypothetical protein
MGNRAKRLLHLRACYWYEMALSKLTGISKTKAETRLKQMAPK